MPLVTLLPTTSISLNTAMHGLEYTIPEFT